MNYIALLPWLFFFAIYSYRIYVKLYEQDQKALKIWPRIAKILRFDMLILIIIFVFFLQYDDISTIHMMLFFMINLFLFVNCFYEDIKSKNSKKIILKYFIPFLIIVSIPVLFYAFTNRFITTCLIMFAFSLLAYPIVVFIKHVTAFFLNIGSKKEKS